MQIKSLSFYFSLLPIIFLTACDGPFSTFMPEGTMAQSISSLWWIMFAGAFIIFLIMMGLFLWVMIYPKTARKIKSKHWIIYGGLVFPGIILPPLVIFTLITGERIIPLPSQNVPEIHVEAYQWGWNFRYPDHGEILTKDVLYLPEGEAVDLHITSRDVIHSFWIPKLGGKMDAIPGKVNVMRIRAEEAGTYKGLCSEFCGVSHTIMRFDVNVIAPEEINQRLLQEASDE